MAAGQGFKTFTTGEVLTAGDVNGYLMQGINVFADATARDAAITAPAEGQFAYTRDNNSLWYYTGSAWAASGAAGDIEGVTVTSPITGGGTSGTVNIGIDSTAIVPSQSGQSGKYLTTNGTAASWGTVSAPAPTLNEQLFTSSGTFTPATGITKIQVTVAGGGGGGGGDTGGNNSGYGGGGGQGGVVTTTLTVTPGTGYTVTIGGGGAGASGNSAAGTASSFASTSAVGGPGSTWNYGDPYGAGRGYPGIGPGAPARDTAATANTGCGGGGGTGSNTAGKNGGSGYVLVRWVS